VFSKYQEREATRLDGTAKIGAEAIKQSEENGELPQGTRAYF
jgi:hypothetical protein